MEKSFINQIAEKLDLRPGQVENTLQLLEEGATIPFISRYRKERTGSLDEVQIEAVKKEQERISELEKRREAILKSIEEQGKLTPALEDKIRQAQLLSRLEDLYLPYKPKRKTKATAAREKGLEPLARFILKQAGDPEAEANRFVNEDISSIDEALQGAMDIIAEEMNENTKVRNAARRLFDKEAVLVSQIIKTKQKEEGAARFKDYFDYSEKMKRIPSHRFLAVRRGAEQGFLRVSLQAPKEKGVELIEDQFIRNRKSLSAPYLAKAAEDCWKRLLSSSLETEFRNAGKEKADDEAIAVFSENLRQLLLSSPLGEKRILGVDPGYRTGCKLVCLDESGSLLHFEAVYPHPPQNQRSETVKRIQFLVNKYRLEAVAVGNGTAGRESEILLREMDWKGTAPDIFMVSESGASVYSASEVAREEFPKEDVTVRGAVSIGRRLMDPLAELVKIDPKSIGVGQYQHDVDQKKLKESLDSVVMSVVNAVGVNVNTASRHLLQYVSGLGPVLAQNIVDYRSENGLFKTRSEIKKVKRMGEKAFVQCAGFLRIPGAKNPLDNSAVHPERYTLVKEMAKDGGVNVTDLIENESCRNSVDLKKYISEDTGMPTLLDILRELSRPGRDPRKPLEAFSFSPDIKTIDDLQEGMVVPGIVTNITNFGAFVDIGVKQDGLVHISQMADCFVSDPNEIVKLNQQIMVKVISVDTQRKRIQLSMKEI